MIAMTSGRDHFSRQAFYKSSGTGESSPEDMVWILQYKFAVLHRSFGFGLLIWSVTFGALVFGCLWQSLSSLGDYRRGGCVHKLSAYGDGNPASLAVKRHSSAVFSVSFLINWPNGRMNCKEAKARLLIESSGRCCYQLFFITLWSLPYMSVAIVIEKLLVKHFLLRLGVRKQADNTSVFVVITRGY